MRYLGLDTTGPNRRWDWISPALVSLSIAAFGCGGGSEDGGGRVDGGVDSGNPADGGLPLDGSGDAQISEDGPCDVTSDGSDDDTQALIDAASDGDIVCVPAGTHTWDETVGLSNRNILVRGAGIGQTTITRDGEHVFYVGVSDASKGQFRISGFTFSGNTGGAVIAYSSESLPGKPDGLFRIDHNEFQYPTGQRTGIGIRGVAYGVIDHNVFDWAAGFAVHVAAFNASDGCTAENPAGNWINSQPLDLGTERAVYMEDNTFTSNGAAITAYDTSAGGARAVFRYNTVTGGFYYSHWTRGCEIGGVLHEIYNNSWIGNGDYGIANGAGYPIRLESGTGVIFNNYAQNFHTEGSSTPYVFVDDRRAGGSGGEASGALLDCDGTRAWDGNIETNGWPCLGQIGRGPGKTVAELIAGEQQPSVPLYLWNNGAENACATGGPCTDTWDVFAEPASHISSTPHGNGDVDYVKNGSTPRPDYTPYTYPHPVVTTAWP